MQKREQKDFFLGAELLTKRTEWTALKQELAAKVDGSMFAPSKKLVVAQKQLKLSKTKHGEQSDDEDDEYSDSEKTPMSKRYCGLDIDQIKCIEFFMVEIDKLLNIVSSKENKDPRRDEDLITLMALRQFVARYFAGDSATDNINKLMRSKIKMSEMIMVLSSLKFKDKNPDMILVTVKQFTDIFLELVVNPASFKTSQINFYRGGKCIINIFIFLIKSYFQQARIMKSIYSDDFMKNEVVHLFIGKDVLELLKMIVDATIELAATEFGSAISSGHQSAFQLHTNKNSLSQGLIPPVIAAGQAGEHENHISNSSMEKTQFNQSLLMRSGQGKAGMNQYSFELGRETMNSEKQSNRGDNLFGFKNDEINQQSSIPSFGAMDIPTAGNFNSFVSNLLRKKHNDGSSKHK